jgi:2-polyprenyl-3-methyl-5-hydroxy-6-metoxy-1,4-benzoquinol methylase
MVYANPAPADLVSGEYYDKVAADYYVSPAKLASDYAPVRFERELRIFRQYCSRGAVLDAGCSSGGFLFELQRRFPGDYEILGTDISGRPLDYAESHGIPVVRGQFLSVPLENEECDALTFWAVLEHVSEPAKFIARAAALLKPGGVCFVLVPNLGSLAFRLLGARYRYVCKQHLNYFGEQTLQALVETQFSIIEFRTTHFNPLVILQDFRSGAKEVSDEQRGALLERTTKYKTASLLLPLKVLHKSAEKFLGSFGLADNIVAVLRKRAS